MIDTRLYQAGIIAIPLKQIGDTTKPNPNFLVIENQFGISKSMTTDIQTGNYELEDCITTNYKLVFREILSANSYFQEEFSEKLFISPENLAISVDLLPLICTHQRIKNNLETVNLALSHFQFRGSLEGLQLQIDETILDEIINNQIIDETLL